MRVFDRGRFADSTENSGTADFGGNRMALSVESAAEMKRSPNIGQFSSMQGGRFLREIQQRTKIKMGQGL